MDLFRAALRILRWQQALGTWATLRALGSAWGGGAERVLALPGGAGRVFARANQSDTVMFEQVFVGGDYNFALPFVPRSIIDAGANAGYASLFFAAAYPGARILAIEPDPENFELLRRNTAGVVRIEPLEAGLWASAGALQIADPAASKCMISLKAADGSGARTVPAVTVPEAIARLGGAGVDLLKIDIEGAELGLFNAESAQWLRRVRALMIELHDPVLPGCAQAFYRALGGMDFLQYQRGDVVLIINRSFEASTPA